MAQQARQRWSTSTASHNSNTHLCATVFAARTTCLVAKQACHQVTGWSQRQSRSSGTFRKCSGDDVRSRVCIAILQVAIAPLCLLSLGSNCRRERIVPLCHVCFWRESIVDVPKQPRKLTLHMLQTSAHTFLSSTRQRFCLSSPCRVKMTVVSATNPRMVVLPSG